MEECAAHVIVDLDSRENVKEAKTSLGGMTKKLGMLGNPCFLEAQLARRLRDLKEKCAFSHERRLWRTLPRQLTLAGQKVKGPTGYLGGPTKKLGMLGNPCFREACDTKEVGTPCSG